MLRITDHEHFGKAAKKAAEIGKLDQFLAKVLRYSDDTDKVVVIGPDTSFGMEFSFAMAVYTKKSDETEFRYWYNGGIIFNAESSDPTWNIHT